MAIDFPASPTDGQIFSDAGTEWVWRATPGMWAVAAAPTDYDPVTIVESDITGSGQWQVWGDVMIQWGIGPGSDGTIIFNQAFQVGTVPAMSATDLGPLSADQVRGLSLDDIGHAGFTYRHRFVATPFQIGAATQSFTWIAVGEAPDELKQPKEVPVFSVAGTGGGASVTTGPEFPADPAEGDMHYMTVEPVGLAVYYTDVDSSQWVQTNGGTTAGEPVTIVDADASDNSAGYIIWGDTLVEWGIATSVNTGAQTVPFSKAFKTTPRVQLTPSVQDTGTDLRIPRVINANETQFTFIEQNGSGVLVNGISTYWLAIGACLDADAKPEIVQTVGGAELQEFHDPTGAASYRVVGTTLECWGYLEGTALTDGVIILPKTYANAFFHATVGAIANAPKFVTWANLNADTDRFQWAGWDNTGAAVSPGSMSWRTIGEWDGVS